MTRRLCFTLLLALGCAHAPPPPPPIPPPPGRTLESVAADFFEELLKRSPSWATSLGDRRFDRELEDPSDAAVQRHDAALASLQARLAKLDVAQLSNDERVTFDALAFELESRRGVKQCQLHRWAVDPMWGPHIQLADLPLRHGITDDDSLQTLVLRLGLAKARLEAHTAELEAGLAAGFVAPTIDVERVLRQLDEALAIAPEASAFVTGAKLPEAWTPEHRGLALAALTKVTAESIHPGLTTYRRVLREVILPKARPEPGVGRIPGGGECWRALAFLHTSTKVDPEELHLFGLDELTRLHAEMLVLGKRRGAKDLATLAKKIKADKRAHVRKREELLAHAAKLLARAQEALPLAFDRLPKTPIGVKALEAFREQDAPAGYYQEATLGTGEHAFFYVNTFAPETRWLGAMAALTFHEAVPGHHLQIALAHESEGLPAFRRRLGQSAFVEGWALYAEGLAAELGLYETDDEKLGRLSFEAWRAARLVVDTGLHLKGWSRAQAIEVLEKNTLLSRGEIENEVDRYVTWPAQALAYKVGQVELLAIKEKAKERLGARFADGRFHDALLSQGAIPLTTLRAHMERWIEAELARPVEPPATTTGG